MTALDFLHCDAITTLLTTAAEAGGLPLSVHFVQGMQESSHVLGCGGAAVCRLVNDLPEGKRACRQSRVMNAAMAQRQQRCIPWMCHMGFSCVSMPLLADSGFVLTLGPYCPAEAAQALESDVESGWAVLTGSDAPENALSLEDIHRCPASAPPTLARWVAALLLEHYEVLPDSAPEDPANDPAPSSAAWRFTSKQRGLPAAEIAAALMSGNQQQARQLIQGALKEAHTHSRIPLAVRRARTLAVVTATLEALERAGADTTTSWNTLPDFLVQVQKSRGDAALLEASVTLLAAVKRLADKDKRHAGQGTETHEGEWATVMSVLNTLMSDRLFEGVTLEEAATAAGKEASSISHYLKRRFDMSFLEYFGRLRVDEAKRMLRETKLTASEIARRVGIADLSNFRRTFKRFEGITPSEYKKRHGKSS